MCQDQSSPALLSNGNSDHVMHVAQLEKQPDRHLTVDGQKSNANIYFSLKTDSL